MRRILGAVASRVTALVPLALIITVALGASPASASTPSPAINSFTVTPTTLTHSGGTVTFTGVLKYGASCTLSVSPGITGLPSTSTCTTSYSKKLTIPANTSGASKTYTFSLSVKNSTATVKSANKLVGLGAAPPPISFTPSTLVIASSSAPQGVEIPSTPQTVTITNNSTTATQNITSISFEGTADYHDYTLYPGNCVVALSAGASCDFTVTFTPYAQGTRTATVQAFDASWGAGTNANLPVSGTSAFGVASVQPASIDFDSTSGGPQGVDTQSPQVPVTVTNSGNVPLLISNLFLQGGEQADFIVEGNTCFGGVSGGNILSVGKSCSFDLSFQPTDQGTRTSGLVIQDNTSESSTTIPLSGTAVWTTSTLSKTSVVFSPTAVNSAQSVLITITNTSSATLTFTRYAQFISGEPQNFVYQPTPTIDGVSIVCSDVGFSLGPDQSCQFGVVFYPAQTGLLTTDLYIYDNTNNSTSTPQYEEIELSGTGTVPS